MTDANELARLRELEDELGGDVIVELVELFLEDAPLQVATMRQALSGADGERLKRAAHSLKGSCSNLGLERLAGAAAKLEQHAAAEGCGESAPLIESVASELERLQAPLAKLRDQLSAEL